LSNLQDEFNDAFFNFTYLFYDETGLQSAQALSLSLGLVPAAQYDSVVTFLLNDIVSNQRTHLTTGIIGTKYLMLALHQMGRNDIALALAETLDYPSWGYMVVHPVEPATTLWELWNTPDGDPGMDSRNHIMFGSVGDWFYKALAGIDHPDSDVGFRNFVIAPSVVGDLRDVSATFIAATGNISVNWQRQGGEVLCATAAQGHSVNLDCSSIGSEGVIEEIIFASYGTPRGSCGAYGENRECHTPTAHKVAEYQCLGRKSCNFLAHEDVLGTPSCGASVFKRLHVQARCGVAASSSFALQASIPVGSTATVTLPALDMTNITVTANGATVWTDHNYVKGADGISNGFVAGNKVSFVAGSGDYSFVVNGYPGEVVCANTTEYFNLTIACPKGKVITQIQFASFGTPYGDCGQLYVGSCNAGSTNYIVEKYCLMQNACELEIDVPLFGDPCYGTPKSFASQVLCGNI